MIELTSDQFKRFAELIHKQAAITIREQKLLLLSNRIRRRLHALDIEDFDEYYNYLLRTPSEMVHFLGVITTNESYFWRTKDNFELLRKNLLPLILQSSVRPLSFWSAGCSTGEEPYNLAMELTEAMKTYGPFDFGITATDISKPVVDFAKAAKYTGRKIEKIPPMLLARYFRPSGASYEVRSDIKARIEFRVENLFDSTPRAVHCIFCRNVMIYFEKADQEILIKRFFRTLLPGGVLIVGHAETLHMMKTDFEPLHFPDGTAYRKPVSGS